MIYLQVKHIEDEDCDLFSFSDLNKCVKYIYKENLSKYIISDIAFEEYPLGDYTFIENLIYL